MSKTQQYINFYIGHYFKASVYLSIRLYDQPVGARRPRWAKRGPNLATQGEQYISDTAGKVRGWRSPFVWNVRVGTKWAYNFLNIRCFLLENS
jgi:hypothetical protein